MSKPELAMLPWWPRDYLAATRGFSLAERGAYTDLLWLAWDMGALPNDPKRLARMLGVSGQEFDEVWPAIKDKFVVNGSDQLVNVRLERERVKAAEYKANAQERAKRGGEATKRAWEQNREGMAASLAASKARSQASSPSQARLDEGSSSASPTASANASTSASATHSLEGDARGNLSANSLESSRDASGATSLRMTDDGEVEAVSQIQKKIDDLELPEARVRKAIMACPDYDDEGIHKMTHADVDLIREVRRAM